MKLCDDNIACGNQKPSVKDIETYVRCTDVTPHTAVVHQATGIKGAAMHVQDVDHTMWQIPDDGRMRLYNLPTHSERHGFLWLSKQHGWFKLQCTYGEDASIRTLKFQSDENEPVEVHSKCFQLSRKGDTITWYVCDTNVCQTTE